MTDYAPPLPPGATLIRCAREPLLDAFLEADGSPGRATWGDGPWTTEPDVIEWRAAGSALPRLMVRTPNGHWCGYVGVPEGHPLHGRQWEGAGLSAHGGVNYSSPCQGWVCHQKQPGESGRFWWFGFDCGHVTDASPAIETLLRERFSLVRPGVELRALFEADYRAVDYVMAEIERLAAQLDGAGMTDWRKPRFAEHEVVRVKSTGEVGTVVHVYRSIAVPGEGYEVEFTTDDGKTTATATLSESELEKAP